jgi:serine/threonine protein kinase
MAERAQQITSIFHSAIAREPHERGPYLDGACGGDEALRQEVEALIKSHENAGTFIASPVYERGAELLEGDGTLVGRSFGQYRLVSLLGVGGMGEVYLADDTRLDRRVALKVLPAHLTSDHTQLGRFQQEARAASALNHPNIVTIYEINEAHGTHYIATELIEGMTLRARMASGGLTLGEAIEIAVQVASALNAAHSAGVVHRDIKPENVMLRPDGYVKVLDFGIAKLMERQRPVPDAEAATRALVQTGRGVVMGTTRYMSPEQARGTAVDARTDIWSLGVVLYEMAAHQVPFPGETAGDCIATILKTQPEPLTRLVPDLPKQLEWIVQKALRKDRDERYQTVKELLSDLRAVRQEVEATGKREESFSSSSQTPAVTAGIGPSGISPGATGSVIHTTSSAEYLVNRIKRHKLIVLIGLALFAVIIAGIGLALYKYANRNSRSPIFQNAQLNRITTSGNAKDANISSDGKFVVYTEDYDDGSSSILVKQTATGNTLVIVPPAKVSHGGTAFSPDGTFVYYLMDDLSSDITSLYRVPSIGGTSKKIMSDVDSPPAVSPDGNRIVFMREHKQIKYELVVAMSDGTGERVVATRQELEWFEDEGPAWSPDGKTIACAAGASSSPSGGSIEYSLLGFDAETGKVSELSPKRWKGNAGRVIWLPDGNTLAFIASESSTDTNQVWRIALPGGTASRITNDVVSRDSGTLGVTADGLTLVTVTRQTLTRLELVPADGNMSQVARITLSEANREGDSGFAWTPDGRIVFSSDEGSQSDLWIMNANGNGRRRLTSDSYWDGDPAISSDGRYIVFASNRPGGGSVAHLWRMDLDGGNLTQLTSGEDTSPNISPDVRWVIYSSWNPGPKGITGQGVWKVSIDGGAPVQLTDYNSPSPEYSPDGNWIVATVFDDQVTPKRWRNAIIPASGGSPIKQFDRPNFGYQHANWTRDGRHLSYIGPPAIPSNIWLQPIAGGEPRKLTDFKTDMIFAHAWSWDGKILTVVRGNRTTDVVLMKDSGAGAP